MAERKFIIDDTELDGVVGGFFQFDTNTNTITYTHKDGSVTTHQLLDVKKAWVMSNQMHAELVPEDDIMAAMVSSGYVAN